MSLIEQAGKRLEALRRTGSEVSGDLSELASGGEETAEASPASTIERAINRAGILKPRAVNPEVDPASVSLDVGSSPAEAVWRDGGIGDRREPRIDALLSGARETASNRIVPLSGKPVRSVELDFALLASRGYLTPDDPEGGLANQFRKIKWPLVQACQGKVSPPVERANRIMITSAVPGEGKSFVSLNLALSIAAERDHSVLLVDADTTRPSLSRLLGMSGEVGLLDLLSGREDRVEAALLRTNVDRLALLPAGTRRPHATELLASEAMERLVDRLSKDFPDRILIFDAPPLLAAPEPAVLASHMGQIVLVTEADRTTHGVLRSALAAVEACPVVRMVLNKASNINDRYPYAG